jgi:hypothetical protein
MEIIAFITKISNIRDDKKSNKRHENLIRIAFSIGNKILLRVLLQLGIYLSSRVLAWPVQSPGFHSHN